LDDGDLERRLVAELAHDDGHLVQPRTLRRAPAALAGDDLETAGGTVERPHQDRLQYAALLDRARERVEFLVHERPPRLHPARLQMVYGHGAGRALRGRALARRRHVAQQRAQPAPELARLLLFFAHGTTPSSRRSISPARWT